jgi:DNA-binding CsgD family transcriptional regulator
MGTVPANHSLPGRENGKRGAPASRRESRRSNPEAPQVQTDPKDWEQIQLRRYVNTLHSSVLLCGTALIDQTNAQIRILIVISEVEIGVWQDKAIVQAKETFHLTARETTVVQHLLKGWTNKEIANEMRLAEQTIKEYFKHISEKTSTTTRTGIVMKIIHSGLRHALATPSPQVMVPTISGMPIELVASA